MTDLALRALRALALVLSAIVALSWVVLAVAHVDDHYRQDVGAGIIVALVDLAQNDLLYPPVFDGAYWAGTRYGALPIVVAGLLHEVFDDPNVATKVTTYASSAVLVALMIVILLRARVQASITALLVAALLVTPMGLRTMLSSPRDVLPAMLQLAALALVSRSTSIASSAAAGLLCGLALLAKVNALWAVVAIVIWLAFRARRSLLAFAGATILTAGLGVLLLELATEGRFLDNFREVIASQPTSVVDIVRLPVKLLGYAVASNPISLLLPAALVAVAWMLMERRPLTIYQLALPIAFALFLVTIIDPGAGDNHFLDTLVLAALVVGLLTVEPGLPAPERQLISLAVLVVVGWSIAVQYQLEMREDLQAAVRGLPGTSEQASDDAILASEAVAGSRSVLAADARIVTRLGLRPVVLDAYLFEQQLVRLHPEWSAELARRVSEREFERIVMFETEGSPPPPPFDTGFGLQVDRAIADQYRRIARIGRYAIYAPRRTS